MSLFRRFTPLLRLTMAIAVTISGPAAMAQQAAPRVDAHPALWVVRDADTTIYLFGTVHLLPANVDWFDAAVKRAFDSAEELTLEVTLPDDRAALARAMTAAGTYPAGTTLSARLTPAQRAALTAALKPLGLDVARFDRQEPWLTTLQLTLGVTASLGYDPANGVEERLRREAITAHKRVTAFETAQEQIGFFDATPENEQIAGLIDFFHDAPTMPAMFTRLITSWTRGNPNETGRIMNEDLASTPETARILLTDRNRRWADAIRTRMDQPGTVFVAVGAGHLAGADSVQHFLEAQGITVRRVTD
jgi:hypothetical protein